MDDNDKKRLQIRRTDLIKEVEIQPVVDYLFSKGILNEEDVEQTSLDKGRTRYSAVRYVLDALPRKGRNAFGYFCEALRYAEQEWLAENLEAADPRFIIDEPDCVLDIANLATTPQSIMGNSSLAPSYRVQVCHLQVQILMLMKELQLNKDKMKLLEQQVSKDDEQYKKLYNQCSSLLGQKDEMKKKVENTVKQSWFKKLKHNIRSIFHPETPVKEEYQSLGTKSRPGEITVTIVDEEEVGIVEECPVLCQGVLPTESSAIVIEPVGAVLETKYAKETHEVDLTNKPPSVDYNQALKSAEIDGPINVFDDDDDYIINVRNFLENLPKPLHKPKKTLGSDYHRLTTRKLKTLMRKLLNKAMDIFDLYDHESYKTQLFEVVWDLYEKMSNRIWQDWMTILDGYKEMADYIECDDCWIAVLSSTLTNQIWTSKPNDFWTVMSIYTLACIVFEWEGQSPKLQETDKRRIVTSVEEQMGISLATKVAPWLVDQGGWVQFVQFLQLQTKEENAHMLDFEAMNLILTLMAVGADEEQKDCVETL